MTASVQSDFVHSLNQNLGFPCSTCHLFPGFTKTESVQIHVQMNAVTDFDRFWHPKKEQSVTVYEIWYI